MPTWTDERAREHNRAYIRRRIDAGLCTWCGRPGSRIHGCDTCRAKVRAASDDMRSLMRLQHRCAQCGEELPPDYWYTNCSACRERVNAYNRALYAKKRRNE